MAQTGNRPHPYGGGAADAFNQSDWDKIRALVAPDLVYIETGSGRRIEGVDAYVQTLETWKRAFPDTSGTMLQILVGDDHRGGDPLGRRPHRTARNPERHHRGHQQANRDRRQRLGAL